MSEAQSAPSEARAAGEAVAASHASDDYLVRRQLPSGGAAGKYRELVIGRPGFFALLRYELVMLISSWVPGALGLVLRRALYPLLLGECGRKPVFGHNVVLRHPHKIRLGDNVIIDDNCLLDAKGSSNDGIRVGDGVFLGRNTILSCKNGDIVLDDGVNIGFNSQIFSGSSVRVGKDGLLAAYCYLIGGGHESADTVQPIQDQKAVSHGVTLQDNVWLGAGVKVLDGVTVGADCIVGAGAVVAADVPAGSVAAGVPARVIRER
ncbi:MAG: acyltransferase [Acidobacteriota bacterium]|jgi:acetyltransferase-like isoleucine patch superfamily enzyme